MVKEGIPFVLVPAAAAVVLALAQFWVIAAVFLLLTGFMLYFFRDPERVVPRMTG
jgi:phosphatidylserine decarboxylase